MSLSLKFKEFLYTLSAKDKYSDFDSRKLFNRINKPDVNTSLLASNNDSTASLVTRLTDEGVHEVRLAWRHIKKWLYKHCEDINASLLDGYTDADIHEFEKDLGCNLPICVVEFFRLTGGQSSFNDNGCSGLFFGLKLCPIDEIAVLTERWRRVYDEIKTKQFREEKQKEEQKQQQEEKQQQQEEQKQKLEFKDPLQLPDEDSEDVTLTESPKSTPKPKIKNDQNKITMASPKIAILKRKTENIFPKQENIKQKNKVAFPKQGSIPPNAILPLYAHSMWIPIVTDRAGNYIALDLSHDPESEDSSGDSGSGQWGQIILFGREFDTKFKIADNFGDFLLIFANDLELGSWALRTFGELEDVVCGVESELVFRDNKTKKEIPYLDVLRTRATDKWIASLTDEQKGETTHILDRLKAEYSYQVPAFEVNTDSLITENLNQMDLAIENATEYRSPNDIGTSETASSKQNGIDT